MQSYTYLIKLALVEETRQQVATERHQQDEDEGESKRRLRRLHRPQHAQAQHLDEREAVHTQRAHLSQTQVRT